MTQMTQPTRPTGSPSPRRWRSRASRSGSTWPGRGRGGPGGVAAERARMEKDLAAARKEAAQMAAKLGNPGFTGKAPADVVAKSRQRQADAEADIARLEARLASPR